MKTLLFGMIFMIMAVVSYSQTEKPVDKKVERKAQKDKEREWMAMVTKTMIEDHRFVLEADYLDNKTGSRILVNSMVNFIIVDSTTSTIQLGSTSGAGFGGTGMLTVEGKVNNYTFKKTEKKHFNAYYVSFVVFASVGSYNVSMYITDDGQADATVQGNTSGQFSFSGKIFPLSISRVYKGQPRY
ncbi:MAG: DUF4251 domain-containing protein [Bacteroidetes bacterium]|nr:DUF4251 domain-containing protein [Bacteroidota bacterium]